MSTNKGIFSQIIAGEAPAKKLFQDEWVTVFFDRFPQRPIHFLVVPNEPIRDLSAVQEHHKSLLGHMLYVAAQVAKDLGMKEGYRLITNVGEVGGQEVPHLHLHVVGGEPLGSMLPPRGSKSA